MTNKTLTEKRFNEILKEKEENYFKSKFVQAQKFFGDANKWCWIIGIVAFGLTFLVMLATSFTTSILFLAQNGLWKTFHLVTGLYDFFSNIALFFLIGAGIFKLMKHFHKKRGIKNGR